LILKGAEFLLDEVKLITDTEFVIGILFIVPKKERKLLFLEITAENVFFVEKQKDKFIKLFGRKNEKIYLNFYAERAKQKYFDFSRALDFLKTNKKGD